MGAFSYHATALISFHRSEQLGQRICCGCGYDQSPVLQGLTRIGDKEVLGLSGKEIAFYDFSRWDWRSGNRGCCWKSRVSRVECLMYYKTFLDHAFCVLCFSVPIIVSSESASFKLIFFAPVSRHSQKLVCSLVFTAQLLFDINSKFR